MPEETQHGKPRERRLGSLKGKIWIAPDFDDTPQEIIDAFEGKLTGDSAREPDPS